MSERVENSAFAPESAYDPAEIDAALCSAGLIYVHSELGHAALSLEAAKDLIRRSRRPVMAAIYRNPEVFGASAVFLYRDLVREALESVHRP